MCMVATSTEEERTSIKFLPRKLLSHASSTRMIGQWRPVAYRDKAAAPAWLDSGWIQKESHSLLLGTHNLSSPIRYLQ